MSKKNRQTKELKSDACRKCHGYGEITVLTREPFLGYLEPLRETCPKCNGTGKAKK